MNPVRVLRWAMTFCCIGFSAVTVWSAFTGNAAGLVAYWGAAFCLVVAMELRS